MHSGLEKTATFEFKFLRSTGCFSRSKDFQKHHFMVNLDGALYLVNCNRLKIPLNNNKSN